LIKALINIERTVDLCEIAKKNNNNTHVNTGTVSQAWRGQTLILVYRVKWVIQCLWIMWQKEKEVEYIKSKNRTRDDRVLVTTLLHWESFRWGEGDIYLTPRTVVRWTTAPDKHNYRL